MIKARIAGAFYLLTLVTGGFALLAPGLLGEGALTLWLLLVGVNASRWQEMADAGTASASRVHA